MLKGFEVERQGLKPINDTIVNAEEERERILFYDKFIKGCDNISTNHGN